MTNMAFDTLQDVIDFKGEDYTHCYVPDAVKQLLKRWDETSAHYESIEHIKYQ